jgi:hypothetical protein
MFIPNLEFFHPGFRIQGQKGTGSRIQDLDFSIPDPGVKKHRISDPQHRKAAKNKRLKGKRKNFAVPVLPDVGREISDHVDIGNDEIVLEEEVAQEVPLLVRVVVRLIT